MIDVPDIPPESLVSSYEAYRAIRALKCNKARGLDGISNRILETFIFELSPVIADLYDTLMREGFVPSLLKRVILRPLPKQRPPQSIENELRPISPTCHITKIMERFTLSTVLSGSTSH